MPKPWASHNYTKMYVDYRRLERDVPSSRSDVDLRDRQVGFRESMDVTFPILLWYRVNICNNVVPQLELLESLLAGIHAVHARPPFTSAVDTIIHISRKVCCNHQHLLTSRWLRLGYPRTISRVILTSSNVAGTDDEKLAAVFTVCVMVDHNEPCCALCVLNESNNVYHPRN